MGYQLRRLIEFGKTMIDFGSINTRLWKDRRHHPTQKQILVILPEHLGDLIAVEPWIRALRSQQPLARIHWLVQEPYRDWVDAHPEVDMVWTERNVLMSWLLTRINLFHHTYNLHIPRWREDSHFRVYQSNKAADQAGIHGKNYLDNRNLLAVFSELAGFAYPRADQPKVFLRVAEGQLFAQHAKRPKGYAVLHRDSLHPQKNWTCDKWLKTIAFIIEELNLDVVDVGLTDPLPLQRPRFHSMVGRTDLRQLTAIVRSARLFVGVDSGPAHLANACKIPGVILFGSFNNFRNYQVYSGWFLQKENVRIVHSPEGRVAYISVESVQAALLELRLC